MNNSYFFCFKKILLYICSSIAEYAVFLDGI